MTSILEEEPQQDGVSTVVFTIVIVGVLLAILVGVVYTNVMDRLNANDTWRQTELRRQRDDYKGDCEENYSSLDLLIKWNERQGHKPPPDFTKKKLCQTTESVEKGNH